MSASSWRVEVVRIGASVRAGRTDRLLPSWGRQEPKSSYGRPWALLTAEDRRPWPRHHFKNCRIAVDGPGGDDDELAHHHSSPKRMGLLPLLGRVCQEAQVGSHIRGLVHRVFFKVKLLALLVRCLRLVIFFYLWRKKRCFFMECSIQDPFEGLLEKTNGRRRKLHSKRQFHSPPQVPAKLPAKLSYPADRCAKQSSCFTPVPVFTDHHYHPRTGRRQRHRQGEVQPAGMRRPSSRIRSEHPRLRYNCPGPVSLDTHDNRRDLRKIAGPAAAAAAAAAANFVWKWSKRVAPMRFEGGHSRGKGQGCWSAEAGRPGPAVSVVGSTRAGENQQADRLDRCLGYPASGFSRRNWYGAKLTTSRFTGASRFATPVLRPSPCTILGGTSFPFSNGGSEGDSSTLKVLDRTRGGGSRLRRCSPCINRSFSNLLHCKNASNLRTPSFQPRRTTWDQARFRHSPCCGPCRLGGSAWLGEEGSRCSTTPFRAAVLPQPLQSVRASTSPPRRTWSWRGCWVSRPSHLGHVSRQLAVLVSEKRGGGRGGSTTPIMVESPEASRQKTWKRAYISATPNPIDTCREFSSRRSRDSATIRSNTACHSSLVSNF